MRRGVLAFVVVMVGCALQSAERSGSVPGWTGLPDSPLSPRYGAHAFWVGGLVVVMGGADAPPCPPMADCAPSAKPPFRDGAAFDPSTGRWHSIEEAPVPLGSASSVVAGDHVYLWTAGWDWTPGSPPALVAYDAGSDRWRELPLPMDDDRTVLALAAVDDRVVAYQGSQENGVEHDFVFDPRSGTWTELPPDPLIPSFDRTMVWTDTGLVLFGIEHVPQPGSEKPALYRAAILDLDEARWHRLPDSEVVGYDPSWFRSGRWVVNPTLGASDGGAVNGWDRAYTRGGMLDPRRGAWSPLPTPPPAASGYPGFSLAGGDHIVSLMGAVLHVPSGTWFTLPPPPGGPTESQALTWTGDALFAWGGVRWDDDEPTLLSEGWLWRPPAA
jgi:hypothetical protein